MSEQWCIRHTEAADIPEAIALSERVQDSLTRSGSLQQIGPIARETFEVKIRSGNAYVIERAGVLVGGYFLEPLNFAQRAFWRLDALDRRFWFLSRFMLDPEFQGQRLGEQIVRELQRRTTLEPNGALILDCWEGNESLRAYYSGLGFRLHGLFPEGEYRIAVMVWMPVNGAFDFSYFPMLETPRLRLREMLPEDAGGMMSFRGEYEVTKYNSGAPYQDIAQARAAIEGIADDFATRRTLRWGIVLKEAGDDAIVGQIGYNYWARRDHRAAVGFDLARIYWGRGLMTEALHAVVQFGFERMQLNRIDADADDENIASQRVLTKVGFVREGLQRQQYYEDGTFHDLAIFGLLKQDYVPPKTG
ncbi:MAG: GNAT family N-acetyltransferase [Anaerolineae bacterium]|nr:GNAT family N-acetyltransferase [Anaerolineae bacterium]